VQPDSSARLLEGIARIGQTASPEQSANWLAFLEYLYRWNRVHSLTAVPGIEQAVDRHLLDALAAWPGLASRVGGRRGPGLPLILDVGAGTGVPGIPLAIAMPQTRWVLVERVARKAAFLRQAVARLSLGDRVTVSQVDVRDLSGISSCAIILSRAFAALPRFVEWTAHLADETTQWAYLAGRLERVQGIGTDESEGTLAGPVATEFVVVVGGVERSLWVRAERLDCLGERHLVWVSQQQGAGNEQTGV
jgi:16S rRNA (guanine527-N7)-methyltransferase